MIIDWAVQAVLCQRSGLRSSITQSHGRKRIFWAVQIEFHTVAPLSRTMRKGWSLSASDRESLSRTIVEEFIERFRSSSTEKHHWAKSALWALQILFLIQSHQSSFLSGSVRMSCSRTIKDGEIFERFRSGIISHSVARKRLFERKFRSGVTHSNGCKKRGFWSVQIEY